MIHLLSFSQTYVLGAQKNLPSETVLLITHNMYLSRAINMQIQNLFSQVFFELSLKWNMM